MFSYITDPIYNTYEYVKSYTPAYFSTVEPTEENSIAPVIEKVVDPLVEKVIETTIETICEKLVEDKIISEETASKLEPQIVSTIDPIVEQLVNDAIEKIVAPLTVVCTDECSKAKCTDLIVKSVSSKIIPELYVSPTKSHYEFFENAINDEAYRHFIDQVYINKPYHTEYINNSFQIVPLDILIYENNDCNSEQCNIFFEHNCYFRGFKKYRFINHQ